LLKLIQSIFFNLNQASFNGEKQIEAELTHNQIPILKENQNLMPSLLCGSRRISIIQIPETLSQREKTIE
jgi:hypothetical protein